MALNLNDLIKKANAKGITQTDLKLSLQIQRPWQQESVLFVPDENEAAYRNNQDKIKETTREQLKIDRDNIKAIKSSTTLLKEKIVKKQENIEGSSREYQVNNEGITSKQCNNDKRTTRDHLDNNNETIKEQLEVYPDNDRENNHFKFALSNLVGLQKNIFTYVLEACLAKGGSNTGAISTRNIAKIVNCSYESVKTTLLRLIKKGLIIRLKGKGCRSGFIMLTIPNYIQLISLDMKHDVNKQQPGNERDNKQDNILDFNSSSNIKTTTLSQEWLNIDIEPLKSIGFSEMQLMQLQNKNTPDIVQESIYHFAYGMENNTKFKNYPDPLNVFMGVLRKGLAWFEKEYKSHREILMQQFLEQKKLQNQREQSLKEEVMKIQFEEWLEKLENDEKTKIASEFAIPSGLKNAREAVIRSMFFEYFKKNIRRD